MKQVYQADDGKIFQTEEECFLHEQFVKINTELFSLVKSQIPYCDDAGFDCFSSEEAVAFIMNNIDEINKILFLVL